MVLLALGAVMSLSGISSCKKNQPVSQPNSQVQSLALDPASNFQALDPPHTPVPSTLLLLGSGVAGMAFFGWKRRTKR